MKKVFLILILFIISLISGYYAYDKIYPIKIQKFAEPLYPIRIAYTHMPTKVFDCLEEHLTNTRPWYPHDRQTTSECIFNPHSLICALDTFHASQVWGDTFDMVSTVGIEDACVTYWFLHCRYGKGGLTHPSINANTLLAQKILSAQDIQKYKPDHEDWKIGDTAVLLYSFFCTTDWEGEENCPIKGKEGYHMVDLTTMAPKKCRLTYDGYILRHVNNESWRIVDFLTGKELNKNLWMD